MTKPNYTEVMLDLETMGNGPNAAIVAIGAVAFDIQKERISNSGFYQRVLLESAVKAGGVIDPATVTWWLQQSQEARDEIAREDGVHIIEALQGFSRWLSREANSEKSRIWGNGASFDNVILRSAYQRTGREAPWLWWNDRCYRTIKGLYGHQAKIERTGTHHHALADAEAQAVHLLRMLNSDLEHAPYTGFFEQPGLAE